MDDATRPLHILLVHQLFVLAHEAGGTRHAELATHLAASGERVTVVAPTTSYLTGRTVGRAGERTDVAPGFVLVRAASRGGGSGFLGRLASFISFTATSFIAGLRVPAVDAVWGTSPPLFQALGAWALARARRVPSCSRSETSGPTSRSSSAC